MVTNEDKILEFVDYPKGVKRIVLKKYTLVKRDGKLINVFNESNYSVTKNSYVFEYFNSTENQ